MSHYTVVKTKIRSQSHLLKALQDMGFKTEQLRVNKEAQHLEGFQGDQRAQTAEIILPRAAVGGSSNDIGFKLQGDGSFEAIISDYDKGNRSADRKSDHAKGCNGYSTKWLKKLNQRYAYHKMKDQLSENGFFIEKETVENGEILIECSSSYGGY